jgi:hypothetical protein
MMWAIIGAEALIIIALIAKMIMKRASGGPPAEEESLSGAGPEEPGLDLPEEEKWE